MQIKLVQQNIESIEAEIKIEYFTSQTLKEAEDAKLLEKAGFKAEQDSICFLHEKNKLVCGVDALDADSLRSASAAAMKALSISAYKSLALSLVSTETISALVEGFVLGGYQFELYKSKPKEIALESITLTSQADDFNAQEQIFNEALIIANATCFTRDIVNTAPQELNPETLALLAKKLSDENSLECTILNEADLKQQNMHAMLAVGRASVHESQLIHLSYKPKNPKKIISLVGKGLTYDSGGLSLKPATSMVTMKMDKAGACAVLGMIKAASELGLDVEIHAFIGAVENMIGGNAYKPDDILVSRSKTTIEVRNTDAEGRLVLADVLDYAQEKVQADYIFDFATLTGACMVALGQYTTGVMGHSNKLKHHFFEAANNSGELVGTLPFNRHLKKLLKSDIADISNTSSKPYGGAITAGLFLDTFIKEENKEKWLHFDIAGSAYTDTPWDCNVYGATGAGVRLMSNFLRSL
jgi:leucyl aminopeptidase